MLLPSTSRIRECPNCKALLKNKDEIKMGAISALIWSDGKGEDKSHYANSLLKCSLCGCCFWRDESKPLRVAHEIKLPNLVELVDALDRGLGDTREREIILRVGIWWNIIKPAEICIAPRDLPELRDRSILQSILQKVIFFLNKEKKPIEKKTSFSDAFIAAVRQKHKQDRQQETILCSKLWAINLSRLIELLNENSLAERVMKSELYREEGNYKEALKLLKGNWIKYNRVINRINQLCKKRKRGIHHWSEFLKQASPLSFNDLTQFWDDIETKLDRHTSSE